MSATFPPRCEVSASEAVELDIMCDRDCVMAEGHAGPHASQLYELVSGVLRPVDLVFWSDPLDAVVFAIDGLDPDRMASAAVCIVDVLLDATRAWERHRDVSLLVRAFVGKQDDDRSKVVDRLRQLSDLLVGSDPLDLGGLALGSLGIVDCIRRVDHDSFLSTGSEVAPSDVESRVGETSDISTGVGDEDAPGLARFPFSGEAQVPPPCSPEHVGTTPSKKEVLR